MAGDTDINIEIVEESPIVIEITETGPAGVGVPAGGNDGQVLAKASNSNYDTEWVDQTGGGGGGAVDSVNGKTGVVVLNKSDIGLSNVDNTSDASKPVSTAQATADALVASNAATALSNHESDTTNVHGIPDTSALETISGAQAKADAKVANAINDGITTVAPSQNAVFDALANKQPLDADLTALANAGNSSVLANTTASFSTADETKLDGIEPLADVTDATNVNAAGATMNSDTTLAGNAYFLDEDLMTSNDATKVPSQQSVKSYVDTSVNAVKLAPCVVALTGGDYTTIGAAILAGETNIFVTNGAYTENSTILITANNVSVVGESTEGVRVTFAGATTGFSITDGSRHRFEKMTFIGHASMTGSMFSSTQQYLVLENIRIQDVTGTNGKGVSVTGFYANIRNCQFKNIDDYAIVGQSTGIRINGCEFEQGSTYDNGAIKNPGYRARINENFFTQYINGSDRSCIYISNTNWGLTIADNLFDTSQHGVYIASGGNVKFSTITGNMFNACGSSGINIFTHASSTFDSNVIDGNNHDDNLSGYILNKGNYNIISNNQIKGRLDLSTTGGYGLRVYGDNNLFQGNRIDQYTHGIKIESGADNNRFDQVMYGTNTNPYVDNGTGTQYFNIGSDLIVPDQAYDATTWNSNNQVPTKNALRDKFETLIPLDEDNMASDSSTKAPSQQSVKAYVDAMTLPELYDPDPQSLRAEASSSTTVVTYAQRTAVDFDYWADGNIGIKWDGTKLVGFAANSVDPAVWEIDPAGAFLDTAIDANYAITDIIDPLTNYAAGGPILDIDGMDSIMFYHGEESNGANYYSHIGIAAFRSGVLEDCGRILTSNITKAEATGLNVEMGGAPYVVRGEYVYVFFADMSAGPNYILQSVARCKVADLKAAINAGNTVPEFKKWYNGTWMESGLGGRSSEIWANPSDFIRWSDVIYLEAYETYMGIYSFNDGGWNFGVRFSKDLVNWTDENVLLDSPVSAETIYVSLSAPLVASAEYSQRTAPSYEVELYYTSSVAAYSGGDRWSDALLAKRTITISQEIFGRRIFRNGVWLENEAGQKYEIYNNDAGSFGVYDHTTDRSFIDIQAGSPQGILFANSVGVTSSLRWSFTGGIQSLFGTDGLISDFTFGGKPYTGWFTEESDGSPNLVVGDALIAFGAGGSSPVDVQISRIGANILALGSGDKLQQSEAPTTGNDLVNKTYADTKVAGDGTITSIVKITQAAYDALSPPVATTLYIVEG